MIARYSPPLIVMGLIGLLVYAADAPKAPAPAAPAKLQFNRDVRPILAENCFACHGADSAARKAKLRLDQRDAAIERDAIAPGKPDDSEMITRIFLKEDDEQLMPPARTHKALKPEQKAILKRWISEGAEYQPHWSFIAPQVSRDAESSERSAGAPHARLRGLRLAAKHGQGDRRSQ